MRSLSVFAIFVFVAAAGAVGLAQPQTPAPSVAPSASPAGETATASPAPAASPAAPTATPTPVYHFVYKATPAPNATPFPGPGAPEIDEVDLNDTTLVPPADIHARVLTNAAVVSVVAETMGQSLNFPRTAPGVFLLDAHVGDVPTFLRNRGFDVTFVATVTDGRTATVTLPLTIK
jgi:hypothetical protein